MKDFYELKKPLDKITLTPNYRREFQQKFPEKSIVGPDGYLSGEFLEYVGQSREREPITFSLPKVKHIYFTGYNYHDENNNLAYKERYTRVNSIWVSKDYIEQGFPIRFVVDNIDLKIVKSTGKIDIRLSDEIYCFDLGSTLLSQEDLGTEYPERVKIIVDSFLKNKYASLHTL